MSDYSHLPNNYDDNYATCKLTFATLRIIHNNLQPDQISKELGIEPSKSYRKGELNSQKLPSKMGIWCLSTELLITSRDIRRHLDWLITQLQGKENILKSWQAIGFKADVFCYWLSTGQGGPTISPKNMQGLSALNLELTFDFYDLS